MKLVSLVQSLATGFLTLSLLACDGEKTGSSRATLTGRWEVAKASRNTKPTQTLQGTYFDFGPDGKMSTNLPTLGGENVDYEVDKKEIHQKAPQPLTYIIKELTDSSLVLTMEIRAMQFEMHLRRAAEPGPESMPEPGPDTLPETTQDSMQ